MHSCILFSQSHETYKFFIQKKVLTVFINDVCGLFGRPFVKRFALCYPKVVLSLTCLCVTLVYCGQTVGWIKMKLGVRVGLIPGHIVLDGDSASPPQMGTAPSIFRPYLLSQNGWMDQDATWYGGRPRP